MGLIFVVVVVVVIVATFFVRKNYIEAHKL